MDLDSYTRFRSPASTRSAALLDTRGTRGTLCMALALLVAVPCCGTPADEGSVLTVPADSRALSPLCQAFTEAVDWSPCAPPVTQAGSAPYRVGFEELETEQCERAYDMPGCKDVVSAYYQCLIDAEAPCLLMEQTPMYEIAGVVAAECDEIRDHFWACTSQCAGRYRCEGYDCHCTEREELACCVWPDCPTDGSLSRCAAICSPCRD